MAGRDHMLGDDNPIKQITAQDIKTGWAIYDHPEGELEKFILEVPAAKIAHDAAVRALEEGDTAARSTWEGFLRALYVVARKLEDN